MNQQEKLILRSPMRKQLGGLWILFCALGAFLMWQNGPKSEGSGILLFGAGALALLAMYRCLTFSLTVFLPGKVPTARNVKAHFGIFKQEQEVDFDELEILRRDMFLPYCQLYAFSSPKYLKAKLKPEEFAKYEDGTEQSPGMVIIDHSTKKECEKFTEQIWTYYGLWGGVIEESGS
ncbi:MAG: hypothetical protein NE327_03930 [Lentisphaeraceae bacterium]|nr:hypothetical protein [Lentisphaeraceae bacterium]